jgi:hypothetical protein
MSDQMPQALALRSRRRIVDDAAQGLGSARGAHISIRGGRFRLVDGKGVETPVPTLHLDVVVVDANDKPARVYYKGDWKPDSDDPPLCWSDNGSGPSTQAMAPQAPTCQACPHNVRGSAMSFNGTPTTACSNRKKIAVIIPDDPAVNVYEFQITPGSLTNFRNYCQWIGQQATGVEGRMADIADFVTRVEFDPDKQFVMTFKPSAWADDEHTLQVIEYIDQNKLSDQAVGRLDVACDPEVVAARLAAGPAPAAIAAPAAPKPAQNFALPPRTNGAAPQALNAPPAASAPAAPPAAPPKPARGASKAKAEPQEVIPPTGAQEIDTTIPAFLRRAPEATQGVNPPAPPRFGVGQAPPPPAEIADALSKAMALPTRRA